jgi:hypothetical protein
VKRIAILIVISALSDLAIAACASEVRLSPSPENLARCIDRLGLRVDLLEQVVRLQEKKIEAGAADMKAAEKDIERLEGRVLNLRIRQATEDADLRRNQPK